MVRRTDLITRSAQARVEALLGRFPAVALLGPRQSGKTTLAGRIARVELTPLLAREVPLGALVATIQATAHEKPGSGLESGRQC